MKISQQGLDLIKQHESFSPVPYLCPAGKLTIGFGHVVQAWEHFTRISEEEAEELLHQDVSIAENCVNSAVKVPITQNQFDAMVSLAFNIGCEAFRNSTFLRMLNNEIKAA